ncbi:pectin lyase fold/virulence factor [Gymnopilus junonius]|uniref:galacturonan 1,4-alpha-galacturonidase n=1 Tax=Gymnopilus junonius TaxID=109634 RepID=A0A9P5TIY7_GYMJU|nr:pectin lyase fold/virulence factor [Gymnopilus junonius]
MKFASILAFLLTGAATGLSWNIFTVPHSGGQDDTPALLAALPKFSTNSTILFQQGITYNIFTPIKFPTLNNVEVRIEGNLTYPSDITTVQTAVASSSYPGAWYGIVFRSTEIGGSLHPKWGWVDAHGQAKKRMGFIRDMKLWKPIGWNFATSGSSNIHIFNNKIVAVSDSGVSFSAGGENMLFENNSVQNGDDCLTVGSGAINITFRNSYCEGGHGLSIGSLGENGAVANVQNNNTLYGARFKSWTGGNGLARNITWKNIAFYDVPFPIYITQNYWDQEDGPKPTSSNVNNTHIADFLFQGFVGIVKDIPFVEGSCVTDPCWYSVAGATGKEVAIFDLYPDTATNIVAKDILAVTETHAPVAVMCNATTVRILEGPFIPTRAGL